jgi:hypothetical protein
MLAAAKDQARRLPDLERQFRRNRPVGAAADAVGTEIFSNHLSPTPVKAELSNRRIGQLPEIFKKNERFLRLWLKPLSAEIAAGRDGGGLLLFLFSLIFTSYRGGWGPVG